MTQRRWLGHAPGKKQSRNYTFAGTWVAGETVTLTIDNIDLVVTIGAAPTPTLVATAVYQAYSNTTMTSGSAVPAVTGDGTTGGGRFIPQFDDLVATNPSAAVLNLEGRYAGRPVTISLATNSAAGTITPGTETAATGPHHADNADNYSANGVPVLADDLVFDFGSAAYKYGAALGVQLDTITLMRPFTGTVGLPEQNTDDQTGGNSLTLASRAYAEWRPQAPSTVHDGGLGLTTCYLGLGEGQGCGLFRWNFTNGKFIAYAYTSGERADSAVPAYLLVGTHTDNELHNLNADVGIAYYADDPTTLKVLNHGNGQQSGAKTYCGEFATLTGCTIVANAGNGTLTTSSAACTVSGSATLHSGNWIHTAGNVKELTINGGKFIALGPCVFQGTFTLSGENSELDLSQGSGAVSFSGVAQLHKGITINDPNGRIAAATQFKFNGCDPTECKLNLGNGRTLTKAA